MIMNKCGMEKKYSESFWEIEPQSVIAVAPISLSQRDYTVS